MKTTELFVELIVIGYGTVIWLSFFVMAVFGYSWIDLEYIASLQTLVPSLIFAYVLGILIDRLSDWAFRLWDKKIRTRKVRLLKNKDPNFDYQRARTIVYDKSESLRAWFYYGRSRVRICRGWTLNFLIILISSNFFIFSQFQNRNNIVQISLFTSFIITVLLFSTIFSWYRLTTSEYERLSQEYKKVS